jgi:hypothetical protein
VLFRTHCISEFAVLLLAALLTIYARAEQPPAPPRFDVLPTSEPTRNFVPTNYQPQVWAPDSGPVYREAANRPVVRPQRLPPVDNGPASGPDARVADNRDRYQPSPVANPAANNSAGPSAPAMGRGGSPSPSSAPPPPPPVEEFKPGQIIAWVGDQAIQAGDVLPIIEQALAPKLAKIPREELEKQQEELDRIRRQWMKQALAGVIETKLLYLDFLRHMTKEQREKAWPQMQKRAEEQFYEKQLPKAMEKAQVETAAELDRKLREYGSSLEKQKLAFVERAFGQSRIGEKIDQQPEVTHQEMLDFYRDHSAEFDRPARARWEKLTVRFDKFNSKAEAWAALGVMGNEVLRGAPLSAVAKRQSQGADAAEGGWHDWTTQASLVSAVLDRAVFSLPLNRLSERLEDKDGFHIVRVLEREDASRVPFTDAQVEIKEKIRQEKVKRQIDQYVENLKKQISVWTIFDDDASEDTAPAER